MEITFEQVLEYFEQAPVESLDTAMDAVRHVVGRRESNPAPAPKPRRGRPRKVKETATE